MRKLGGFGSIYRQYDYVPFKMKIQRAIQYSMYCMYKLPVSPLKSHSLALAPDPPLRRLSRVGESSPLPAPRAGPLPGPLPGPCLAFYLARDRRGVVLNHR